MKKGKTEIIFVLDRSASMSSIKGATISGFNEFLRSQKDLDGEAFVTLYQFSNNVNKIYENIDINEVEVLSTESFVPRGMTALNDAIGMASDGVGERLKDTPEEERPEKVVMVVLTDGEENRSVEYNKEHIKKIVEHQKEKYGWEYIFLGATEDAVTTAQSFGIAKNRAVRYSADLKGSKALYRGVADAVSNYRTMSADDFSLCSVELVEDKDES